MKTEISIKVIIDGDLCFTAVKIIEGDISLGSSDRINLGDKIGKVYPDSIPVIAEWNEDMNLKRYFFRLDLRIKGNSFRKLNNISEVFVELKSKGYIQLK